MRVINFKNKVFQKPVTSFLILVLLLSSYFVSFAADTNPVLKEGNSALSEAYALVFQLLEDKEIIPQGEAGVSLTRAEFVQFVAGLFCQPNVAVDKVRFEDVDVNDKLYNYLCEAVAKNLISDSVEFRPNDAITWNEAVKICCSIAGYDAKALYMGGYPDGYIRIAAEEKMLKNCNMSSNIDSDIALQLIWNVLNSDMMEATSFTGDSIGFRETRTVLEAYFDIYIIEGILNANEYTEFGNAERKYIENTIQINGTQFYTEYYLANDYLGYHVRAYCKRDDMQDEVVLVYPVDNCVLELKSSEVVYLPSNKSIEYGDEKTKEASLDGGFEYIYNGKVCRAADDFIPKRGKLCLIDNDNDGYYDVVSVEEYYYMTVEAVNAVYLTLTDEKDQNKKITVDSNDIEYFIYNSDGEELSFTQIKNGDVLAVLRSKDSKYIEIVKCEKKITGKVDSITKDGQEVIVDGQVYTLDSEFYENNKTVIEAGQSYTFVIGMYGEIAARTDANTDYTYGYVYEAAIEKSLDINTHLKVFDENGVHQIYTCAEKVWIDEEKRTPQDVYNLFHGNAQLIRYKLDKDGYIHRIDTATVKTEYDFDEIKPDGNNLTAYHIASSYGTYYNGFFGGYFNASSAIIFNIPTDLTKQEIFSIGNNFKTVNYSSSQITPYNIDISGAAEVIVYTGATQQTNNRSPVLMVENVSMALDLDGEVKFKINGWSDGNFEQLFINPEETEIPSSGDIIRYTLIDNEVTDIKIDIKGDTLSFVETDVPVNVREQEMRHYQMGSVYSIQNGYALISNTKDSIGVYVYTAADMFNVKLPSKIAIYERWSKTIRNGDANDIKRYLGDGSNASYLVVFQSYFNSNYAFVYMNE